MLRCFFIFLLPLLPASRLSQDAIRMAPFPKAVELGSPGPWGTLESYKVRLSCPPRYLSFISIPSERTEWKFPFETAPQLEKYLSESGLTPDEIAYLLEEAQVFPAEESLRVFPSPEVIIGMPTALRAKFYRILARFPENTFHRRPAFLNTANVSRYFYDSRFKVEMLRLIATLSYPTPSGHGFFLSDIPYLMKQAMSSEEERQLLNALLRVPALMVRLNLSDLTSAEELTDYWTAGFKNKQVRPLFESVMGNTHVDRLEVGHLLPPMARRSLNSFPDQSDGLDGRYPDWFWTCYNFFRFTPRNVYANSEEFDTLIQSEFMKSQDLYEFGDLLLLKSKGRTVHGCIYIADDIVYTKNGSGLFSPTILMKLQDVVAYHDLEGDVILEHYRNTSTKRSISHFPTGVAEVN